MKTIYELSFLSDVFFYLAPYSQMIQTYGREDTKVWKRVSKRLEERIQTSGREDPNVWKIYV